MQTAQANTTAKTPSESPVQEADMALGWSALQIFTGLIGPMIVGIVIVFVFSKLFNVRAQD